MLAAKTPGQLCATATRSMNLGNPSLLFHYFILDDRKHGIAAAQRESPDLEKGLESIPIEAFRG